MKIMIKIDGSKYEGGGQILRTACVLSVVSHKPCHVFNIRKGRDRPGLMRQHLLGIRALGELCQAKLEGDELGSKEIWFSPGEIRTKDIRVKIETAGSITLVLQTLIPAALLVPEPIRIVFKGGATDTFFSPTIDYFRYVFLKILEKIVGQKVAEVKINQRGFYPEGGAEVEVKIYHSKLNPINLIERGTLKKVNITSGASESLRQKRVAERQIAGVKEVLGKLKLPMEEKIEYYDTQCPGSQINVIGEFENTILGADNLGKLGKSAEQVGKEVAEQFLKEGKSNACLDQYMADQILPYLGLTRQKSKVTVSQITQHSRTNIWTIQQFLDGRFKIKDNLISWIPR